jgi:catechol 2,3-dioxygenase-like lactoylglutathione lyase family enzyme
MAKAPGTFGLTHIALAVKDPARSAAFYGAVFGSVATYLYDDMVQVETPGAKDVIIFERATKNVGKTGGVIHFGFRLRKPANIDAIVKAAKKAGGKLLRRGKFKPGHPFAYVHDPDGYEIEIWYE